MKTLVVGVTSPKSCVLLKGQLHFMVEHGFRVFLLTGKSDTVKAFCEEEKCTYIPIHIKREISLYNDLKSFFEIWKILKNINPDIVNFGTPKMGLIGMLASFCLKIPMRIYTCRGFRFETEKGLFRKILMAMERLSGSCSSKIICISSSIADNAINLNLFSKKKIILINKGSSNGIDLKIFSKTNVDLHAKASLLSKYSLNDLFIFGFVGRLCKDKGIIELYEAFSLIYNKNKKSRLLLIGKIEEGLDKVFISRLLNHDGIIYLGTVPKDKLPTYYSLFDVFVLPTHREGFGNVLIEAASMGIPVITTSVTGAKDAVMNGYNGILISAYDISALKNAMERLQYDIELKNQYGQNGELWAKNFDQQIIWNGLLQIYNRFLV